MWTSKAISSIRYSPYNLRSNVFQRGEEISLQEFVDSKKLEGNFIVKDGDIEEFVPHLHLYSSPRQKTEIRSTLSSMFGVVKTRKRKSNYLKSLLKNLRKVGVIITPTSTSVAPIVDFATFANIVEGNKASKFPDGLCVDSRDYYIPSTALALPKNKRLKILSAIRSDLNLPTLTRERFLNVQHKFGSPASNISGGKYSMIRLVVMKKRLVTSGRAVISIAPFILGTSQVNIDTVYIPKKMFDSFFNTKEMGTYYAIITRYPINSLGHTPTYKIVPWEHNTVGVPPSFTGPQNADFDGDTVLVQPILDFEAAVHAAILGDPCSLIFNGSNFVVAPSPHIVIGSGLSKDECWKLMFKHYTFASLRGELTSYLSWYKSFESSCIENLKSLPSVGLKSLIYGNFTMNRIIDSRATRMNKNTMLQITHKIGKVKNDQVDDNLMMGVSYSNIHKVFSQGRESVVESKRGVSKEGKKQNIVQFAIPDLIVQYDYSLCRNNSLVIDHCFINSLPVVYKLPKGSVKEFVNQFKQYIQRVYILSL